MEIFWIIIAIQAIACSALSNFVAKQKGYDSTVWGFIGFFLGIIALIAVAGLPRYKPNQEKQIIKNCHDCLESINAKAYVCKHCGCKFSKESILAHFISKLKDGSDKENFQAINYLYEQSDISTIPDILKYIENFSLADHFEDSYSFKKAVALLLKSKADGISDELIKMLEKTKQNYKSKIYIEAIAELKDESAIPAVIKHLDDHSGLRYEAQQCLIKFGDAAIPYLKEYAANGDKKTKKLVAKIISNIRVNQK